MNLTSFKQLIKNQPIVFVLLIVGAFVIIVLIMNNSSSTSKNNAKPNNKDAKEIQLPTEDAEQQIYIKKLEKSNDEFDDRIKTIEEHVKQMQVNAEHMQEGQKDIASKIDSLHQGISRELDEKLNNKKEGDSSNSNLIPNIGLTIAHIPKTNQEDWVYLPLGSFCRGTLLTGVYAAADINNPLPVLISLDEAFYGPNKTRIPLKGAFVLGKAYGDLVSERALIQIIAISSVLPNQHAFENEQELGYVTDEQGELGIKGQVIYNSARQLALSFMGGFVSGGAQAMADSQVTTHRSLSGDTRQDVTGSVTKNMVFSGLAQSAGKMAEYYQRQASEMIPAVHIKNGVKVVFIMQKGISITGFSKSPLIDKRFMD